MLQGIESIPKPLQPPPCVLSVETLAPLSGVDIVRSCARRCCGALHRPRRCGARGGWRSRSWAASSSTRLPRISRSPRRMSRSRCALALQIPQ